MVERYTEAFATGHGVLADKEACFVCFCGWCVCVVIVCVFVCAYARVFLLVVVWLRVCLCACSPSAIDTVLRVNFPCSSLSSTP